MIDKALIPIAGLGRRMGPLAQVVPKAMFPLPDGRGGVWPIVHALCAEAAAAGIAQTALIVSPGHEEMVRDYLRRARQQGRTALPQRVEIISAEPKGFGYAVARGRAFVGDEPFILFLGDHVFRPQPRCPSCAAQVISAHARQPGAAMVGVQPVGPESLKRVGVAKGQPLGENVYRCTAMAEKPSLAEARCRLITPGLEEDQFLGHFGIYIFGPEIFACLEELIATGGRDNEIELADAQAMLLQRQPMDYYLVRVEGEAIDAGYPGGYARAWRALLGRVEGGG